MISETKLDNSFPEGQFLVEGYSKPYRIDHNCQGGGIMLYVRADIPSKLLPRSCYQWKVFMQRWTCRKRNGCYVVSAIQIGMLLRTTSRFLALYSFKYENFIVLGDFNVGMDNGFL